MFEPPEALPIHTLSKLHYLIHELYLTNHLSFPELLNCGTNCHPLLSLNPTICHLLYLTSTNLILSPFLPKLSLIFSIFPLSRLFYRPYGLSLALLTRKKFVQQWNGFGNRTVLEALKYAIILAVKMGALVLEIMSIQFQSMTSFQYNIYCMPVTNMFFLLSSIAACSSFSTTVLV